MNRKMLLGAASTATTAALVLLSSLGCRVYTQPTPRTTATVTVQQPQQPPPQQQTVTVQANQPTLASGVTIIETTCTPGAPEVCNGLDDNCNGSIDEGCGYSSGNIQITLAWNTGADMDLYVTDPNGETIYYGHNRSRSGGHLDRDARGQCTSGGAGGGYTVENVYWNNNQPMPGTYKVEVHYWGNCNVAGNTPVNLSIAVGGQVIGAYNYTLRNGERVPMATFQL